MCVGCCLVFDMYCVLFVCCYVLYCICVCCLVLADVRCLLRVVYGLMYVVCCLPFVGCVLLRNCLLLAVSNVVVDNCIAV